ncbi:hypothetical protein CJD36_017635 [Flavipsychrobacter stenotrophus]|uniref:Uncharacterized protein n=1 Tax=Flavipsychrobacter stenotrophus TaxID=2077091 RepID=A0A2S7SSZ6_9BACT|nr:hypothetical protein [Flavipsychrobacter stenotrophus]PQJ09751.1 hypothetical protein CJD36_017635 [Flavipsychrobacter stenotrophus]
MGKPLTQSGKPYITTINTGKIEAGEVKTADTVIIADNQRYPRSLVTGYSDGKTEYVHVVKPTNDFAKKVYSGRIDVYQFVLRNTVITPVNGIGGGSHRIDKETSNIMYMSTPASPAIMLINYKDLKQIIPAEHPANEWLVKYNKCARSQHALRCTYAGAMAAGLIGLAINSKKNDVAVNAISGSLTGIGLVGWIAIGFSKENNKFKLQKAIAVYNGADYTAKP